MPHPYDSPFVFSRPAAGGLPAAVTAAVTVTCVVDRTLHEKSDAPLPLATPSAISLDCARSRLAGGVAVLQNRAALEAVREAVAVWGVVSPVTDGYRHKTSCNRCCWPCQPTKKAKTTANSDPP